MCISVGPFGFSIQCIERAGASERARGRAQTQIYAQTDTVLLAALFIKALPM